ncbi:MAG: hypothetical protein ACRDKB_06930 [Actinomycetota bacterium]
MRKAIVIVAAGLALLLMAGVALAKFEPKLELKLSDTKVKGHPAFDIHLEFAEDDDEIGLFTMMVPKGFDVAPDDAIEEDELLGGGTIEIAFGPGCRPDTGSVFPVRPTIEVSADILEKDRTDEEQDAGVHAVWFLDLEPLNRVRLLIEGSKKTGWTVSGAPTPSDNTCNPLIVDLTINAESESGVPLVTNHKKPGKKVFKVDITNQDGSETAHFDIPIKFTR